MFRLYRGRTIVDLLGEIPKDARRLPLVDVYIVSRDTVEDIRFRKLYPTAQEETYQSLLDIERRRRETSIANVKIVKQMLKEGRRVANRVSLRRQSKLH